MQRYVASRTLDEPLPWENSTLLKYVLLIHPLVPGTGQRLFGDGAAYGGLELTYSVVTTTGVMIGTYRPLRR